MSEVSETGESKRTVMTTLMMLLLFQPPSSPSQIIVAYRLLLQVCGAASVEQWQRIHSHPLSLIIRRLHTQTSSSHRADVRALACERAFEYASDLPTPPLRVVSRNRMPVSSGFGLSSAVRKPID